MDDDLEPELAGYEPHDEAPLRSRRRATALRVIVVVGLAALVLPGILVTAGTAQRTAVRACEVYAAYFAPRSVDAEARFEMFGGSAPGWNCYAIGFDGSEVMVRELGLIPAGARLPQVPVESS
ncbi:MAG TPA: hypothetical protein VN200_04155 [Rhodoglobus sp.]|nr:hypothetical protein [Rhodoglobus sp.]